MVSCVRGWSVRELPDSGFSLTHGDLGDHAPVSTPHPPAPSEMSAEGTADGTAEDPKAMIRPYFVATPEEYDETGGTHGTWKRIPDQTEYVFTTRFEAERLKAATEGDNFRYRIHSVPVYAYADVAIEAAKNRVIAELTPRQRRLLGYNP